MLRVRLGRAGCGKTTQVLRELCKAGQSRPQLLLVPEPRSHEMERSLCQLAGSGAALFAEVLSFRQLGQKVLSQLGGAAFPELDQGGRILLMHAAVKQVSSELNVYAHPSRKPAFLQSLLITADEMKSYQIQPEQLVQAGAQTPGEDGSKLRDLGMILGAYDALTARLALDPRDRLSRAAEKLQNSGWATGKDLWLDGFTDFTLQELALLHPLLQQANCVTVTLTCDGLEENSPDSDIFSAARRTARRLLAMAKEVGVPSRVETLSAEPTVRTAPLAAVEAQLFARDIVPVEDCGCVQLFAAGNPRSEVEWTAARIRELVRTEGYRFRDVGVAARNYETYRGLIESVFPRYDVPVFSSAMSDILEKPVLTLVTAALDTAAGGYRYEDLFRYLKSGLTDLSEEDRDILENYALVWNLRGSQWTGEKDWTMHPQGYGLKWSEDDQDLLRRLNLLRRQVVAPLEALRRQPEKTAAGQAAALYRLLETIGLPQRLEERVEQLHRRKEPALAEEYRQLWDILCGGLDQCVQLLGEEPMELAEFAELFRLVLSQYDVGTIPVSLDRVTAGETTRQTGHRVKVLFLLGADDASLPQVSEPPGLLNDDDRQLLSELGVEMGQTSRELLSREMTTIYLTCARPTEKLVVCWPAQNAAGEECRASFLVERLRLLFPKMDVIREEQLNGAFRRSAPLPALEQAGQDPKLRGVLAAMPQYASRVKQLEQAGTWERGRLSRPAVDRLYGQKVPMSASRMDKYQACHFSYFMRYGLEAQPRKPAGFSAPEYGTFVHYVLEHVIQDPDCPRGMGAVEKDKLHQLTGQAVERYVTEELGGLEAQTERFRYLFRRLLHTVQAVVDNVMEELSQSAFQPLSFELGFGRKGDLPPVEFTVDGVTLSVTGFVDRVDGWLHDGRLYLRVVDYKTGRKSFDFTEIMHGMGLQMLLYLFALEQKGESLYHAPVAGAGVLYLPARDVVVKGRRSLSQEEWKKAVDRELVRKGLVLDDQAVLAAMEQPGTAGYRFLPLKVSKSSGQVTGEALVSAQRLGRLGRYLQSVLGEICQEIARGNISADPFWRGPEQNACCYCDYAAACQFEEGRGGDCRRWLQELKSDEFWEQVEQEERSGTV